MKKYALGLISGILCILGLWVYWGDIIDYVNAKAGFGLSSKTYKREEYISWEERNIFENMDSRNLTIFIDINDNFLELIDRDKDKVLKRYSIASGKPESPSPIGNWQIVSKQKWGEGFGTRWLGLNVPWGEYGIHGTNKPGSIGWASSGGCIRMRNEDVEELYKFVKIGTPTVIWGGSFGPFGNGFRTIVPGDTGADVYEVQRLMKEKGYDSITLDGIYGEGLKADILKFRKKNELRNSHDIDEEFYRALGIELFE